MRAGERWAYRERRGTAGKPVQRALVEEIGEKGMNRALIRIEEDGAPGEAQWLPRGRRLVPWDEAEGPVDEERRKVAADAASTSPDPIVRAAVDLVVGIYPPMLEIWIGHGSQDLNLVSIHDVAAAAKWLGVPEAVLMALPTAFVDRKGRILGSLGRGGAPGPDGGRGLPRAGAGGRRVGTARPGTGRPDGRAGDRFPRAAGPDVGADARGDGSALRAVGATARVGPDHRDVGAAPGM